MKILYIYPHPDDESFGPAHVMYKQRREGHEVYLLTLTKGGATKQRHKFGYSIEEMGEVRYQEMLNVEKTLELNGMTVLDLPDSGLKEMDPREIESAIEAEILRVQPNILVTYPVHGISGFHDHLVGHAAVKSVFMRIKERQPWLKRLAFQTITEKMAVADAYFPLKFSTSDEIDCIVPVDEIDIRKANEALDCYVTYKETIDNSGMRDFLGDSWCFEIFQENHNPPLTDLTAGL